MISCHMRRHLESMIHEVDKEAKLAILGRAREVAVNDESNDSSLGEGDKDPQMQPLARYSDPC